MTQQYAELEFDSDLRGQLDSEKTFKFQFGIGAPDNAAITEEIGIDPIVNNSLNQVLGILPDDLFARFDFSEELREGVYVDTGGGTHVWRVEYQNPGGTKKPDGSEYQWGSSSSANDGPNEHTATGASAFQQQAVLMNALATTKFDIRTGNECWFSVGEYSSSGIFSRKRVAVGEPVSRYGNVQEKWDGQFFVMAIKSQDDGPDAQNQLG